MEINAQHSNIICPRYVVWKIRTIYMEEGHFLILPKPRMPYKPMAFVCLESTVLVLWVFLFAVHFS